VPHGPGGLTGGGEVVAGGQGVGAGVTRHLLVPDERGLQQGDGSGGAAVPAEVSGGRVVRLGERRASVSGGNGGREREQVGDPGVPPVLVRGVLVDGWTEGAEQGLFGSLASLPASSVVRVLGCGGRFGPGGGR
jgi:hypothetical protein